MGADKKINAICEEIVALTDAEIKEMYTIAGAQKEYFHPFKNATANEQHVLGYHNTRVMDALCFLRKTIKDGDQP